MPSLQENIESVAAYYAERAPEYDEGSGIGTESFESRFAGLRAKYERMFAGHTVLEIACGTGYWTEVLARAAHSVVATDVNPGLIERSRNKLQHCFNVRFQVADAYSLEGISGKYSAAFAHFWLSHVPKKRLKPFLASLHSRLEPGALVLMGDSLVYHDDWAKRRVDEHGDTFEERILLDGRRFETIKNFPSKAEIAELLTDMADDVAYAEHQPEHVWTVSYRVRH